MLTNLEQVQYWIKRIIDPKYQPSRGAFVENAANENAFIVAVRQAGGTSIPHVLRRRYSIVLLGRRNKRSDAADVEKNANLLIHEIIREDRQFPIPCGAAGITLQADAAGADYTDTDRAYYNLTIQLLI